jgi:hypothetical protein
MDHHGLPQLGNPRKAKLTLALTHATSELPF